MKRAFAVVLLALSVAACGGGGGGGSSGGGGVVVSPPPPPPPAPPSPPSPPQPPPTGGLFLTPEPWNKDVSAFPKSSRSDAILAQLSASGGWGNGNRLQIDFSIPLLTADGSTPRRTITAPSNGISKGALMAMCLAIKKARHLAPRGGRRQTGSRATAPPR